MRLREHPGIGEGRTDILPCDPRQLSVEENYNVRDLTTPEAREELDELKAKVKAHGVRTPLVVRFDGEKIWIVEGHKRHKVALELIAEFEGSDGAEGRNIEFVPITAEKLGSNEIDRDFGLETSNSGSRLKPLELANLIYRLHTQRGLPLEDIAVGLGKSLPVIKNTLALRAMPEDVKDHVKAGHVSATLAKQISKNADPIEAAKLIQENLDENKRITGSKKRSTKVTRKSLERNKPKSDPPKADPPKEETKSELPSALAATSETSQPAPIMAENAEVEPVAQTQAFTPLSDDKPPVHEQLQTAVAREFPVAAFQPPTRASDLDGGMFAIIKTLALEAEAFDLGELDDDAKVEIRAGILKAADRFYRERIGDTAAAEAA